MSKILVVILFSFTLAANTFPQNTALVWEVITPENAQNLVEIAHWERISNGYVAADFSPDSQILALSLNNGVVQLLTTQTLEVIRTLGNADNWGDSLIFSDDGSRLLLSKQNGTYTLWDVESGNVLASADYSDQNVVFWPSLNLQKYYLLHYSDDSVSFHDFITSKEEFRTQSVEGINGNLIITRDIDANVLLWDIDTGELIFQLEPYSDEIPGGLGDLRGVGFTPDGNLWTDWQLYSLKEGEWESYSPIQFWDINTQQEMFSLNGEHWYSSLIFDPTGRYLAAIGTDAFTMFDGQIWIWDLQTRQQIGLPQGSTGGVNLSFNPDGQLFAYGGGTSRKVRINQVGVDHPLITLPTRNTYSTLEFSSDGRLLLNVGDDIRLWGVLSTQS